MTDPTSTPRLDREPVLDGPPGILFNGAAVAAFAVALWRGSERTGDLGSILVVALAWFFVLLAWLFRFTGGMAAGTVMGPRRRAPFRWALAPSLFAIAAALVFGGYAFEARFLVSRPALEHAATEALAGRPPAAGWIGLYPVRRVSVDGTAVRVEIDGQLSFVRDPEPTNGLSSLVWYEPIDDRWSIEEDVWRD